MTTLDEVRVSSIMKPFSVFAKADMNAEDLGTLMLAIGADALPVVDETGKAIGLITKTDIVREAVEAGDEAHLAETPVGALMEKRVIALPENASVARAAAVMAQASVDHLPVVSSTGTLLGLVRALDIMELIARRSGYSVAPSFPRSSSHATHACTA